VVRLIVSLSLAIIFASAAISWLLGVGVHRLLLRWQIIDAPNSRSSHTRPTVRGGGIAIIVTLLVAGGWLLSRSDRQPLLMVGLCIFALAVISFIDDLKSIRVVIRLGCHFLAAVVVLITLGVSGMIVDLSPDAGLLLPAVMSGVLGCLWVVGYTNAFNFMDGINGMAVCQAAITGLGMALLAGLASGNLTSPPVLLSFALAGAALGFLPHNFPNARMFMGDVGSAPLGFLLGVLVLWLARSVGGWLLIPLALLHANFVLDATITLVRRVARGEKWHQAHREHFYQRLVRSGKSHAFVTGWELGLQLIVLALMVLYLQASGPVRVVLIGVVILIWLAFFAYSEVSFRRAVGFRPPTSLSAGGEGRGEVDSPVP
jgi:UDP-N-acetylmuramyl pentapeptide phosphotransferase/UDP-N-acetylglucosamine-1-phosphate transferase